MIVILGGSGQLGTAFRRMWPDAKAPSRSELDLFDLRRLREALPRMQPTTIVNCAAYTAVDQAEADEATASRVNGEAVGVLAEVASDLAIPFITFSTDYVFDGEDDQPYTETSEPRPINAYGRSKLLGERLALEYDGALVIRTSWLLSATHPNFITKVLGTAASGVTPVVKDQRGRPTLVEDLATATAAAMSHGLSGLLHLASPPTTTWFDLAREACDLAGLDSSNITPITSDELDLPAPRPRNSVLVSGRGLLMPNWRNGFESIVSHA